MLVSIAVAGASLAPASVRAQPLAEHAEAPSESDERAQFQEAMRLFDEGRYEEVLPILQALQAAHDEPLYLFNLGQTYRLLGRCAPAIETYQRFLAAPEPDPTPQRAAAHHSAQAYVRALQPSCVQPVGVPEPATPRVEPPPPAPEKSGPVSTHPDQGGGRSPTFWASMLLFGAGAASAVAASYWGIEAHQLERSLEARYAADAPDRWDAQAEQDFADGDRYATRARWVGAAAALSVATGGVLLLLDRRRQRTRRDLSVLPGAKGVEVAWTASF